MNRLTLISRSFVCALWTCMGVSLAGISGCDGATDAADAPPQTSSGVSSDGEGHGDAAGHKGGSPKGRQDQSTPDDGGRQGGGPASAEVVQLDSAAIDQAGIRVETVDSGSLKNNVEATAVVKHDVNRVAHITPLVEGQISSIRATLGDEVEAGQTLVVMRSIALGQARSAVNQAEAALDVARKNYERNQTLVDQGITSQRAYLEAKGMFEQAKAKYQAARSSLRALAVQGGSGATYPLASQIEGTIIEQHASVGENKGPGDELFVVADQSTVWVIGQVPENQAHAVRPNMAARVSLDAYPGRTWTGTVDWIASTIDPENRVLPIRVELENSDGLLRPGMYGSIQLTPDQRFRNVPLVPVDAVQRVGDHEVVFVPGDHDGQFRAQPVELGTEAGSRVEVVEGLSVDQRIVTAGAFDLKATLTARSRSAAHHH